MKDDWIDAALTDDTVVVELLFRLRQSSSEPSKPPISLPLPPQRWGLRQSRSKPVTMMRKESATTTTNTRFSPTTPLSWSGGATSPSDGGYDECSRLPSDPSSSVRSKTFSELKEQESLLLNERLHLRKELASKRTSFQDQRAWSNKMKKMKLDLNIQSMSILGATSEEREVAAVFNQHHQMEVDRQGSSHSFKLEKEETLKVGFILPDLNMPLEEEAGSEFVYGTN